jgi:hypothetical protein
MSRAPNVTAPSQASTLDSGPRKSLAEVMAEQGITGPQDLDALADPDLWASDEEFEQFLAWVRQSRREGS